jgi:hypothetical protein
MIRDKRANGTQSSSGWDGDVQNMSLLKNITNDPRLAEGVIGECSDLSFI